MTKTNSRTVCIYKSKRKKAMLNIHDGGHRDIA